MSTDLLSINLARDFPAAQRGDHAAYGRMVRATQRMVASVALALVRDVQLSEDIAQESFLTAWQRLGQMKNSESFLPWLRDVTRNRAIDHLRTLRYRESCIDHTDTRMAGLIEPGAGPAEALDHAHDAAVLARAMDEIPEDSREVLLLFYREGQSSRDVAALLGISDAAVRKRLDRAREKLQGEVLAQLGSAALKSAPGPFFSLAITSALATGSGKASAAGSGVAALLKASPKLLLGALGALVAALAVMLGAVAFDTWILLKRARNLVQRKALLRSGIAYAALMGIYGVILWWSAQERWSLALSLSVAAVFSVAIILLAIRRARILSSGDRKDLDPPDSGIDTDMRR